MALRDWLSNSRGVATATVATLATHDQDNRPTVATVAGVAVAREVKREISHTLPLWCRVDCPGLEITPLPNEDAVVGCVHPVTSSWRRMDWLTECPAMKKKSTRPTLPEWCSNGCENYHRLELPAAGTMQWCRQDADEKHWQIARIDRMNGCPMAKESPGYQNKKTSNNDQGGLAHEK